MYVHRDGRAAEASYPHARQPVPERANRPVVPALTRRRTVTTVRVPVPPDQSRAFQRSTGAAPCRVKHFRIHLEPTAVRVCVRGVAGTDDDVRELYAGCYARLVGILTLAAASRAEAEEVVQEAFVQLIPRWGTVSGYDDPEAWVRRVAFRRLSNRRRARRVAERALGKLQRASTPGPSGDRTDMLRALAQLSLPQRQVVVMHHLLDIPVEEIAAELGVPVGTVKSRLARGRSALALLLGSEVGDYV